MQGQSAGAGARAGSRIRRQRSGICCQGQDQESSGVGSQRSWSYPGSEYRVSGRSGGQELKVRVIPRDRMQGPHQESRAHGQGQGKGSRIKGRAIPRARIQGQDQGAG